MASMNLHKGEPSILPHLSPSPDCSDLPGIDAHCRTPQEQQEETNIDRQQDATSALPRLEPLGSCNSSFDGLPRDLDPSWFGMSLFHPSSGSSGLFA